MFLKVTYYISLSAIFVLVILSHQGYFTMLAFVEPRNLKINPKNVTESRVALIISVVFYFILCVTLKLTVMRQAISKDHIDLVKREIEMQRRNSVGSDGLPSARSLDNSHADPKLKH